MVYCSIVKFKCVNYIVLDYNYELDVSRTRLYHTMTETGWAPVLDCSIIYSTLYCTILHCTSLLYKTLLQCTKLDCNSQ